MEKMKTSCQNSEMRPIIIDMVAKYLEQMRQGMALDSDDQILAGLNAFMSLSIVHHMDQTFQTSCGFSIKEVYANMSDDWDGFMTEQLNLVKEHSTEINFWLRVHDLEV